MLTTLQESQCVTPTERSEAHDRRQNEMVQRWLAEVIYPIHVQYTLLRLYSLTSYGPLRASLGSTPSRALLLVYRGFLGVGTSFFPFSISRTSTMVGRSAGLNWVHKSPTSMHLFICSCSDVSDEGRTFMSFIDPTRRTSQAWETKASLNISFISCIVINALQDWFPLCSNKFWMRPFHTSWLCTLKFRFSVSTMISWSALNCAQGSPGDRFAIAGHWELLLSIGSIFVINSNCM